MIGVFVQWQLPRKKGTVYSDGELNKLVDSVMHPIARDDPWFWVADTLLHAMVEQDPNLTVRKFLRYSAPKIVRQVLSNRNKSRRARNNY